MSEFSVNADCLPFGWLTNWLTAVCLLGSLAALEYFFSKGGFEFFAFD